MALFTGSGVAMITPFTQDGINYDALGKIIEHIIKGKTNALFVLGTTGEPSTMTREEKEKVLEFSIAKVNKRIPVFAGAGGNNTSDAVDFARRCEKIGADGLLVVTPYYNKCTQNGAVAHYQAISDAVNVPIVAYNVPGRTGFNIAPSTCLSLAKIKNIRAIKEASGNIDQILEAARLTDGKLDLYSGDDSLTVPAMSIGAKGVISVAANVIPETIHNMAALCLENRFLEAAKIQFSIATFVKALFSEVNPIPCKKAMQLLGFDAGIPRLPLTEMEPEHTELLKAEMKKLSLI